MIDKIYIYILEREKYSKIVCLFSNLGFSKLFLDTQRLPAVGLSC